MPKVPNIIPVTDLRQNAAGALKRLRSSKQPVVITQRGRAAAVLLSMEEYERGEHERQILRLARQCLDADRPRPLARRGPSGPTSSTSSGSCA